jgi:hypothetical protein
MATIVPGHAARKTGGHRWPSCVLGKHRSLFTVVLLADLETGIAIESPIRGLPGSQPINAVLTLVG